MTRTVDSLHDISSWGLSAAHTHLNHGSFGGVPRWVLAIQADYKRQMEATPVSWFSSLRQKLTEARHRIANALDMDADQTVVVSNASAGVSVAMAAIAPRSGSTVLVTDHGYGAVSMGAARWAQRTGATIKTIPISIDATADQVESIVTSHFNESVSALVIDQVTSMTARSFPVRPILEKAKAMGIATVVDGAHVPGVVDRREWGDNADFFVANLHKFACSPRGVAVVHVSKRFSDLAYPVIDSWGGNEPFPNRFDDQGTLDQSAWLAAPNTLELFAAHGWHKITDYASALLDEGVPHVAQRLADVFGEDPRPALAQPVPTMRLLRLPSFMSGGREVVDRYRLELAKLVPIEAGFTSFGGAAYLRLSAHLYNNARDFDIMASQGVDTIARLAKAR